MDYFFFTGFNETDCKYEHFGETRNWIFLEILVFWATLGSTILFLVLSKVQFKRTGLMYLVNDSTDFLQTYKTLNGFYSTFFSALLVTVYLCYLQIYSARNKHLPNPADIVWPAQDTLFTSVTFLLMIGGHLSQFIAFNTQVFMSESRRQ